MQLNTSQYTDDRDRTLINSYSDQLAQLGVLTAEESESIETHLAAADEAQYVLAEVEHRRKDALDAAAWKLADDITFEKLSAAVVKLPLNQDIHDLALTVWRRHIEAAKTIVRAGFGAVPEALTARLDDNAARGLAAAEALTGITTAQQAIGAGLVDEWTSLQQAEAEYDAVVGLVSELRWGQSERGNTPLIPARPMHDRSEASKWAWDFRTPPRQAVIPGIRHSGYTDAERRAIQIAKWEAGPYCPASKAEVDAVLAAARVTPETDSTDTEAA